MSNGIRPSPLRSDRKAGKNTGNGFVSVISVTRFCPETVVAQGKFRLTAIEVRQAKPSETGKARILPDGAGLRLVIKPNGSKYWQLRFTRDGKESSVQLGSYPAIDLATARELADQERRKVKSGADPVLERKLERLGKAAEAAITFKAVAEELLAIKMSARVEF